MVRRIFLIACACLTALFFTASGRADDMGRLGLSFEAVVSGDAQPAVVMAPTEDVRSVAIRLERSDGLGSSLRSGAIAAGARQVLPVKQPFGSYKYTGKLDIVWASGESSHLNVQFELTRVAKLKLELAPEDVDLDRRSLTFRINNPAQKATLDLFGENGTKLASVSREYKGAAGGSSLQLGWSDPSARVLYMDLKVYDVAGFWTGVRLTPFSITIQHDDEVEFENGKWDIRKSEEPKLKKTLGLINDVLAKHKGLIQLRLYIAGYTDTVGTKESNRVLSNNRARAIAQWFRKSGLQVPIFYQGFGEDVLAKPTPDETPEPANRRAVYLLGNQTPAVSAAMPASNWQRL